MFGGLKIDFVSLDFLFFSFQTEVIYCKGFDGFDFFGYKLRGLALSEGVRYHEYD